MARVFIGVDPHTLSATIEVVDDREAVLATGRFGTDKAGYAAMRKHVASYPERVWGCVNRVHRLLAELVPGQGKKNITTGQATTILASVRPRDVAGKTRRRLAAEQLADLVAIEKKTKGLTIELKEMVLASGSTLMELPGVGPVVAARTLADTGDVARFADRNRYAWWTGGRAYYLGKIAAGKSRREAMRCLKRRISDALYRRLRADASMDVNAGPGGHRGASHKSSAAGSHPHTGTSDQPLPGPAPTTLPAATTTRKTTKPRALEPAS